MKLADRTILVTGSTQGIGLAIAVRLAQDGANLVLNGRKAGDKSRDAVAAVEAVGGRAHFVAANLTSKADADRLVAETVAHFGQLDVLVNNAGVEKRAEFIEVTEEDYDLVLEVNVKGVFFTTQAAVRHLRERGAAGKIINISSVHEEMAFPGFATYCASKGALKMLMRDLAVELGPFGITVNNIAPGAIQTPMNKDLLNEPEKLRALLANIPLGRLGKPEDIAALASFLASSDADYLTGATLVADGGLMRSYHEQ